MPVPAAPSSGAPSALRVPAVESPKARLVRWALGIAGLVLFALLLRSVGWPAIVANLARVGPWWVLLVVLYAIPQSCFALGWRVLFEPLLPLARFPRLLGVYLAGDAANVLTPGNVAGEPLKVHLLRGETGGATALASITLHKHADMLSQGVYMATGVAIALAVFPIPTAIRVAATLATAGFVLALIAVSILLPRRTYSPVIRRLARWKPLARPLARIEAAAARVDDRISAFYREHPARFFAACLWGFAGWCGSVVETRVLLHFLAPGAGWAHAFAIEGLVMTLNNLFLFVPAGLGTSEGVRVAAFLAVGLPAAAGAAYGLLRRGRDVAWMLPGLVVLFGRPVEAAAGERSEEPAR
jgi:uncharacterized protein (TIRG00374 family)